MLLLRGVLPIWLMIRIIRRNDSRPAKSFRPFRPPSVPWALQLSNLLKCLEMIRKVGGCGVSAIRTVIFFTGGGDASVQADLVGGVRGAPGRRTGLGGGLAPLRGGGRGRGGAGKDITRTFVLILHLILQLHFICEGTFGQNVIKGSVSLAFYTDSGSHATWH